MNRWLFLLRQQARKLWVRASAYALLAVVAALSAVGLAPWVPEELADRLGGDAVETVLGILASSLLAVATFSVGAMVSAYTAVSSAASPRVAALITEDSDTQRALSTFVGVFLYAVVALTAINAGYYGPEGRAILFLFSMGVVALVAFRLLAWINRLGSLARVGHMIELVEHQACKALRARAPGVNDPGTAIEVVSTGVRLLDEWARTERETGNRCDRVLAAALVEADLLDDLFGPVGRYGAADLAVATRLQKSLRGLAARGGDLGVAAGQLAETELDRARETLTLEADRARLLRETFGTI